MLFFSMKIFVYLGRRGPGWLEYGESGEFLGHSRVDAHRVTQILHNLT